MHHHSRGHVTKKDRSLDHVLEHMVYFERSQSSVPVVAFVKNRFGSTNELGILEMTSKGLKAVEPSKLFIEKIETTQETWFPAVRARCLLFEIQALVQTFPGTEGCLRFRLASKLDWPY